MFCVRFCVCVCLREREREGLRENERGDRNRKFPKIQNKDQTYVLLLSITRTFSKLKRSDGVTTNLFIVSSMQHTASPKRNVTSKLRSFVRYPSKGTLLCAKDTEIKFGGV